jgi:hypothetical protein
MSERDCFDFKKEYSHNELYISPEGKEATLSYYDQDEVVKVEEDGQEIELKSKEIHVREKGDPTPKFAVFESEKGLDVKKEEELSEDEKAKTIEEIQSPYNVIERTGAHTTRPVMVQPVPPSTTATDSTPNSTENRKRKRKPSPAQTDIRSFYKKSKKS